MNDATTMVDPGAVHAVGQSHLRVVYLARLREAFGTGAETVALPARDDPSVAALVAQLRARGGAFAHELAPGRAFRVAVNQVMAGHDTAIRAGDEVAFLPPVTGG
jgi:sulfur-carrier protein